MKTQLVVNAINETNEKQPYHIHIGTGILCVADVVAVVVDVVNNTTNVYRNVDRARVSRFCRQASTCGAKKRFRNPRFFLVCSCLWLQSLLFVVK
jgi:hypothetical protein